MNARIGFRAAVALAAGAFALGASAEQGAFLPSLSSIRLLGSTVPANGDINPYGVARVPESVGRLRRGDILVSNFNNASNLQGTGTTIVALSRHTGPRLFAVIDAKTLPSPCTGGVGLTTALAVLRSGWVIVGSLPTSDGTSATAQAGCLIVLNAEGRAVEVLSGHGIAGPWDMTAKDEGDRAVLFVTNVLNGDVTSGAPHIVEEGNVLRMTITSPAPGTAKPRLLGSTVIASGFAETADPAALVIGPTGVALADNGTLYVADTVNSMIDAIPRALTRGDSAGTGFAVSGAGALNGPLGLALAPNGDIITANAGDGNLVETTRAGHQIAVKTVETATGAGSLFGLVVEEAGIDFVDDGDNTLKILARNGEDEQ